MFTTAPSTTERQPTTATTATASRRSCARSATTWCWPPRRTAGGFEFNAGGRLGPALSFSLSGDFFYAQIDASSLGAQGLRSTRGVNLKANLDYRLTSSDAAQISFARSDKRLTPQGYVDAMNLVNVGCRHEFRPDLSLVFTVTDLFNAQRTVRHVLSPGLTEVYERRQYGRVA
ncbi:outer membrane beta-barrel protein [Phenylobacterium sp.]|uniref:outer membrane beta-barrel protein n=1 Tax=Phenylobacterium sp. TaxID=1871053 RepID=UPI002F41EF55